MSSLVAKFGFWLVAGLLIMWLTYEAWKLGEKMRTKVRESKKEGGKEDPFK